MGPTLSGPFREAVDLIYIAIAKWGLLGPKYRYRGVVDRLEKFYSIYTYLYTIYPERISGFSRYLVLKI